MDRGSLGHNVTAHQMISTVEILRFIIGVATALKLCKSPPGELP